MNYISGCQERLTWKGKKYSSVWPQDCYSFTKTPLTLRIRISSLLSNALRILDFRKIEIVQFASRTRQLFVRLLALVKWANSASKVDKCGVGTIQLLAWPWYNVVNVFMYIFFSFTDDLFISGSTSRFVCGYSWSVSSHSKRNTCYCSLAQLLAAVRHRCFNNGNLPTAPHVYKGMNLKHLFPCKEMHGEHLLLGLRFLVRQFGSSFLEKILFSFSHVKERIVPPDPINAKDKEETLKRLDQIIEYRLVTSELPLHMRNLTIGKVSWVCSHV